MLLTRASMPAPAHARPRRLLPWWQRVWPAVYGAVVGGLLYLLTRGSLADDAMISAAYGRNLAVHGEWALMHGIGSNTATSPLNVWLLAGGTLLAGGRALVAVGLVLIATFALIAHLLYAFVSWSGRSRRGSAGTGTALISLTGNGAVLAVAGTAFLATAPVLTSSIGLETYLCAAILLALVVTASEKRAVWCAFACAAAALTRPDMTVAAIVVIAVLGFVGRWKAAPLALAGGGLLVVPWHLLTWWRFGSAFPATLPVKAEQPGWGADGSIHLANSIPMYLHAWPAATWLTLATLAAGLLAGAVAIDRRWWDAVALAAAGSADLVVMAMTAGAPVGYYAGPAVAGLGLCAVIVAARAAWPFPLVACLLVAATVFTVVRMPSWDEGFAPLRQNWASQQQYARIAAELPTDGAVLSSGEIGALAFYCADSGCTVVDPYLADPGRVDAYVQRWRAAHPEFEVNWWRYRPAAPLPVKYRLDYGSQIGTGALAAWPITVADRSPRWAVLRLVS